MKYLLMMVIIVSCGKKATTGEIIKTETKTITEVKTIEMEGKIKSFEPAKIKEVVFNDDLKSGEWARDFSKRCNIYKTPKITIVDCEISPCRKHEHEYLSMRYNNYASKKTYRLERLFKKCRYKHKMDVIKDDRPINDREYTHS